MKKVLLILFILIIILIFGGIITLNEVYYKNLKPASQTSQKINFSIEKGMSVAEIADSLKKNGLIKSSLAFQYYLKLHKSMSVIQAGEYLLDRNQSVEDIAKTITGGKTATDLITILPAKTLEQIKQGFIKSGFDEQEVDNVLKPELYLNHSSLAGKPTSASLEGYLYPETFQKSSTTKLQDIINLSLDQMDKYLSDEIKDGFSRQGLSVHQGLTLSSIVENESATASDRTKVASVFLNRLKINMRLESNATDNYSSKNSNYDTYKINGLPPGPISNVSKSSLMAVANPAQTDYLFFVTADDQKTTYFSKTVAEHNALVRQYCKLNCAPH